MEHFIAKLDFVFINQPTASLRIILRQENDMQVNALNPRQTIEDWYAVRRNDLRQDDQFCAQTTRSL
jgi:hypothetical protein